MSNNKFIIFVVKVACIVCIILLNVLESFINVQDYERKERKLDSRLKQRLRRIRHRRRRMFMFIEKRKNQNKQIQKPKHCALHECKEDIPVEQINMIPITVSLIKEDRQFDFNQILNRYKNNEQRNISLQCIEETNKNPCPFELNHRPIPIDLPERAFNFNSLVELFSTIK